MKIKELIKQLSAFPEDATVYMATDPEGNYYREACEVARIEETEPITKAVIWPYDERLYDLED